MSFNAARAEPQGLSNGTANNPGIGCIGCHLAEGLRAKHAAGGISSCSGCHDDGPPSPENVKPPYYGTMDTKADNPSNDVLAANTIRFFRLRFAP